jgi:hypothetical protein
MPGPEHPAGSSIVAGGKKNRSAVLVTSDPGWRTDFEWDDLPTDR